MNYNCMRNLYADTFLSHSIHYITIKHKGWFKITKVKNIVRVFRKTGFLFPSFQIFVVALPTFCNCCVRVQHGLVLRIEVSLRYKGKLPCYGTLH
jgi:hypothetical protein